MEEEKKINNKDISKKDNKSKENIEVKEIRLEKMSPGFNFVSLKARHRLNELKNLFSRAEYRDYIRKCKNMYSISSLMNNKYSISDLYLREKNDINNIISVFNKIDSKLDSQKIKVMTIKKNKIKNMLKEKAKSSINFFKNNSNYELYKSNINIINQNNNNNNNEENNSLSSINKNINYNSYDAKNNMSNNIYEASTNIQMSKITYDNKNKNKNKKNNILNYKTQYSFRNIKNGNFLKNIHNKTKDFSRTKNSFIRNNQVINDSKNEINNNIKSKLSRSYSDFNGINFQAKQYPLSCKNNDFNITKFGAIIYNHSMFRTKNIVNFLPKNYNLPLLYNK